MASDTASASGAVAGRFLSSSGDSAVFAPLNTNYELHLKGTATVAAKVRTEITIAATGRKLLTVPSGGNFITPIQGPPRVVQGRVRAIEGDTLIVQAGIPVRVKLPIEDNALDLNNGAITVGQMVNITLQPGASFTVIG